MKHNNDKLNYLLDKYHLKNSEKEEIIKYIYPIYKHYEFQKRMTKKFMHHSSITLGEHIIEDTIVTYKLSKKYMKKHHEFNLSLAIDIAMLHDLYTVPWQNNKDSKTKKFLNSHGFRHSLEAVINSINWYPELFVNKMEAEIIIDGIIHHMYPLPVRRFNVSKNEMELKNYDLMKQVPRELENMIKKSCDRMRMGKLSICRSKYKEGRIMSRADKKVSIRQIKNFSSAKALLTGHNKYLEKIR